MITYTQQDYLNTLTKAGLVIDSNLYGHDSDAIQGLTYNSKEAAAGTLFVCKGAAFPPTVSGRCSFFRRYIVCQRAEI